MAGANQIREALAEAGTSTSYGFGEHTEAVIKAGLPGVFLGHRQFDASRDQASVIDFTSTLGVATGDFYVRDSLPSRPLNLSLVLDETSRREQPELTAAKRKLGHNLMAWLEDEAQPGITDRVSTYLISEQKNQASTRADVIIRASERQQAASAIEEIALEGLTLVISDFSGMKFAPNSLSNVVAIKANHLAERSIPHNVGFISLGGSLEIDTGNKRQVDWTNGRLVERHNSVVTALVSAGAQVAAITTSGLHESGFDPSHADTTIALAISNLLKMQS